MASDNRRPCRMCGGSGWVEEIEPQVSRAYLELCEQAVHALATAADTLSEDSDQRPAIDDTIAMLVREIRAVFVPESA